MILGQDPEDFDKHHSEQEFHPPPPPGPFSSSQLGGVTYSTVVHITGFSIKPEFKIL
jgi:hypothetical protein